MEIQAATETSASINLHEELKRHFGYESFRPMQKEIIKSIFDGKELLVVMPTSAGKSLLYQLPALMRPGYTLVISPLISLMADQVDSLTRKGIPAAFINSTLTDGQKTQNMKDVESGKVKLLYVSPEALGGSEFGTFIDRCRPTMLAVDEAHCLSQWGHDFRPAYLKIGEFVKNLPGLQTCAFTATATPRVRDEIKAHLLRPSMETAMSSFKRPNLQLSAMAYHSLHGKEARLSQLLRRKVPTIIYTATRNDARRLARECNGLCYHGDMSPLERERVQELFMSRKCNILAATNAFGLGIDRPDVRMVIHWSMPGSLEAYYQEAGRAGRDGQPAECILLFSDSDFRLQEQMIAWNNPDRLFLKSLLDSLLNISQTLGSDTMELTVAALRARMQWARNEGQLGIGLNVLASHGYIERKTSRQNPGVLSFLKEPGILLKCHERSTTIKARFICKCATHFGRKLLDGVPCTFDQLAEISGLDIPQVKRAIIAGMDGSLAWTPPYYGCTTKLLRTDDPELKGIDFAILDAKRKGTFVRLNEMYGYATTFDCRQNFILRYFGETPSTPCDACDNCAFPPIKGK